MCHTCNNSDSRDLSRYQSIFLYTKYVLVQPLVSLIQLLQPEDFPELLVLHVSSGHFCRLGSQWASDYVLKFSIPKNGGKRSFVFLPDQHRTLNEEGCAIEETSQFGKPLYCQPSLEGLATRFTFTIQLQWTWMLRGRRPISIFISKSLYHRNFKVSPMKSFCGFRVSSYFLLYCQGALICFVERVKS